MSEATRESAKKGHIVVITGPSHGGKSSLIRELRARSSHPTAYVAIDEVIGQIDIEQEDRWEHGLNLAYEEAARRVQALVEQGALVFVESTFTYVPPDERPPQFHIHEIERLLGLADQAGVDLTLIQLTAELDEVLRRREQSERLAEHIVRATWHQHATNRVPGPNVLRVDTTNRSAAQIAQELCGVVPC